MTEVWYMFLGALITTGFTFLLNLYNNNRDDKIHLREKREELYVKLYDFLMKYNCQLEKKTITKDLLIFSNELQAEIVFASKAVMQSYYNVCNQIRNSNEKEKDFIQEEILKFMNLIRKELGVKN